MKYSIIIPTLNEEKLLPYLLNQLNELKLRSQPDFEIIVSDGGSNDKTKEIALKYADKVIIHNESKRQNISEGRNKGAENADGEWLIFLNGDVHFKDCAYFFDNLNKIINTKNISGFTCSVRVNPNEEKLQDILFLSFYNFYFHILNIIGFGMGRGECLVLKSKLFAEIGGFNITLAAGEDFDLFKRVRRKGKIHFSHKVCIYESPRRYRVFGHSKIFLTWLLNSIYVIFRGKSLSLHWEEVR